LQRSRQETLANMVQTATCGWILLTAGKYVSETRATNSNNDKLYQLLHTMKAD